MGWSASLVGREDNHAKSASARVLRVPSVSSPRGKARTRRAPRRLHVVRMTFRSRSRRRPGAVSVEKSLGQRRRVKRVARWPRRQPRDVCQRACTPWADGLLFTGRSARAPCTTGIKRGDNGNWKPQPPTWHDAYEEESRPTAWCGARRMLTAKTTTPIPPARAYSADRRPILNKAKRARATHHEGCTRG